MRKVGLRRLQQPRQEENPRLGFGALQITPAELVGGTHSDQQKAPPHEGQAGPAHVSRI